MFTLPQHLKRSAKSASFLILLYLIAAVALMALLATLGLSNLNVQQPKHTLTQYDPVKYPKYIIAKSNGSLRVSPKENGLILLHTIPECLKRGSSSSNVSTEIKRISQC